MEISCLRPGDAGWPPDFGQASPPPKRLFVRGRFAPALGVAIVGTRRMSAYGRACVEWLAPEIVRLGLPVVSGLALGIDGVAHEAALAANGTTTAVIGSGVDDASVYPRAHLGLARRILAGGGAVVSEYAPGTPSMPYHFPARNRLIAALARAVLVIEAPKKSGAMITARLALEMGRDVWAVPGAITQPNSEGPNSLIQNGATPITGPEDIAAALGLAPRQAALPTLNDASPEERPILELLAAGTDTADAIARTLQRPIPAVSALLTGLELRGAVRTVGGGRYTLYT
ncbi:MAG: DNA-processing protein DprA [Patescibacteria group bacterium]|nr:MAG: DNA-processing protein DprA [Patescibacteria group bacterium]